MMAGCVVCACVRSWKKTKEGPIPFGPKSPYKPPVSQPDMLAAMASKLSKDGVALSGTFGEAELKTAMAVAPKDEAKAAAITAATAALSRAAQELCAAVLAEDTAACAAVEAKLAIEDECAKEKGSECKT